MIGLDTNVLIRYLAQDDPAQSARATEIIERRLSGENLGFVSVVAMAKTVWVLDRAYGLSDEDLVAPSSARCRPMFSSSRVNRRSLPR